MPRVRVVRIFRGCNCDWLRNTLEYNCDLCKSKVGHLDNPILHKKRKQRGGLALLWGAQFMLVEKKVWSEAAFGCVTQLW